MSRWEDFATVSPSLAFGRALAEDQDPLNSAEEYALFEELTFLKIADHFQVPPPYMRPERLFDVRTFPMVSFKNHTLRKRKFYFKYAGFDKIVTGAVIVEETANPKGYRIIRLFNGEYPLFKTRSEWISWRQAVTNMF